MIHTIFDSNFILKDVIKGGFYDPKNDCINFECHIEVKSIERTNGLILPEIKH